MRRLIFLLLILFLTNLAHSETRDQWVCTDDATSRHGDTWYACGVGEGRDEGNARERALGSALSEFKDLCKLSTGCMERSRTVEPKRTSCYVEAGWWKCYRMVEITLY